MTKQEMASVLGIAEYTLETLVNIGAIPHTYVQLEGSLTQSLRFNPYLILDYFRTNPPLKGMTEEYRVESLKAQ